MEVFDRSLTNIPIELHTKYLSNVYIKYISDPDQFVLSGSDCIFFGDFGEITNHNLSNFVMSNVDDVNRNTIAETRFRQLKK
jgi:hypothetical protein